MTKKNDKQTTMGYVYILTNPAFKDNWVKIGMTSKTPDARAADLDNTSVPIPYEVYATLKTSKYKEAEKFIHRMIDRLTDLRIRPNREFFNITPEEAYGIFEDIAKLFDDSELVKTQKINDEVDGLCRRSNTTFAMLNIKPGDFICWFDDPSIQFKVIDDKNKVEYNGDIVSISACYSSMINDCHKSRPKSYKSPWSAFCRKGESKNLNDVRDELSKLGND
jgi:hypothetical protein